MLIYSHTQKEIREQQTTADEVLGRLEAIYPHAILAGGAPRDWYFGNLATDLDIYLFVPPNTRRRDFYRQLRGIGISSSEIRESTTDDVTRNEAYILNPDVLWVFSYSTPRTPVQIVVMRRPTFDCVVAKFSLSICRIWYKDSKIVTTNEFIHTTENKAIVQCKRGYTNFPKYLEKISAKYPKFTYWKSELDYCEKFGIPEKSFYQYKADGLYFQQQQDLYTDVPF